MAKRNENEALSFADEFAALVGQLEQEGYHGIPKAMTPEGLEVLAFDLEERDKLARARAWIKSQRKTKLQVAVKTKRSNDTKEGLAKKTDGPGLTREQQQMAERIRKQQSTNIKSETAKKEEEMKDKKRR